MAEEQKTTLHEQLEQAYDSTVGAADTPPATPAEPAAPAPSTGAPAAKSEATQPAASTAERPRDPATGKFMPADKPKEPAAAAQPLGRPATPTPGVVAAPTKFGVKRPDSWKKELWSVWDKMDAGEPLTPEERKAMLDYTHEREGQYAKGVSAYKAEAEHARRLIQAITPYQDMMAQQQITPEKFITTLANTHHMLTSGTAQDKLKAFARFAKDYDIPLHELLVQGDDGKVYLNQQYFQAAAEQQATGALTPEEIDRRVEQKLHQERLLRLVQDFQAAKDGAGNPAHPHFTEVRQTMDGLLRSGLAENLQDAYDQALKHPRHATIYAAQQEQQRKADAEAKAKEDAEKAARARANAVQPRSATPTGAVGATGKKGLRAQLEEAYDSTVAGRI